MLVVALGAVAALCVNAAVFAGVIRGVIRQQARERELLLNQLMHLSGRTWTPPPSEPTFMPPPVPVALVADPGQWPDEL